MKNILESSHPKQLPYWYLWEDQIEKKTQKSITASLRESLNKMKEQKSELEQRLKVKFTENSLSPPSYTPLYPQLPVPDSPEDLLDLWAPGPNTPTQDLAPQPPPQPVPLGPRTPTSPKGIQLPVLTSLTVEDLQGALRPDLQARGIQVTCVNAENQEINLVGSSDNGGGRAL